MTQDEKERGLAAREAELKKREAERTRAQQALDEQEKRGPANLKERLYDKIRIPIWALDLIIGACLVGIVVCIVLGMR